MLFGEWNLDDAIRYAREESRAEGIFDGVLNSLKSLIDTMGLTMEQAMAALKIPEEEKSKYADLLNHQ